MAGAGRCRLETQGLVDLLKMPTLYGRARRVVLDHLGHRYGRRFANHWEFVLFARERDPGLDFTTPPRRPDPQMTARRVLEILDGPANERRPARVRVLGRPASRPAGNRVGGGPSGRAVVAEASVGREDRRKREW